MAVYVAVYVLPSWIENMLTGFAHARLHTHTHTNTRCKYTPRTHSRTPLNEHKPPRIKQSFLTNVKQHQIHCFRIVGECRATLVLTCSYRSLLQPIHQLTWVLLINRWNYKCQHALYWTINLHCYLFVTPLLWLSDISNCLHAPSTSFQHAPGQSWGRMAVGGPRESGLGWGPHTNTQPNVLIDPMPSYFRTSVRRQGAARRDRQTAVLKDLEQGGWGKGWMEGEGSGGFTALYWGGQQEGRGHKFNCIKQNDGIRTGGDAELWMNDWSCQMAYEYLIKSFSVLSLCIFCFLHVIKRCLH